MFKVYRMIDTGRYERTPRTFSSWERATSYAHTLSVACMVTDNDRAACLFTSPDNGEIAPEYDPRWA